MNLRYLVFVILLIIIGFIYFILLRVKVESEPLKVDIYELSDSYFSDEKAANEAFLGNKIIITGTVKSVLHKNPTTLLLQGGAADIQCAFEGDIMIIPGETITLKGVCTGFLLDVVLADCQLL